MDTTEVTNKKGFNILMLRTFAIASMFILNFAWSGIVSDNWLKLILGFIGSGSITLFIFMLEEGYRHTSNLTKYMLRLLVLAVVSAVPYCLVYAQKGTAWYMPQNIFSSPLTLFMCLGSIAMYDKLKSKSLQIMSVLFLCVISFIFQFEWCPYALILAYVIHAYHDNPRYREFYIVMFFTTFSIVNAAMYFLGFFQNTGEVIINVSLLGCAWPVFLFKKYNGERGKRVRLLSYVAYPLMLIALVLIKKLLIAKG